MRSEVDAAWDEVLAMLDDRPAPKVATPQITKYATHETLLALTQVVEKLQKDLRVAVMAINSQAHKLEEIEDRLAELQYASGETLTRMDFFLGCSLIANGSQYDWTTMSADEMQKLIAEDSLMLNQLRLEFGK